MMITRLILVLLTIAAPPASTPVSAAAPAPGNAPAPAPGAAAAPANAGAGARAAGNQTGVPDEVGVDPKKTWTQADNMDGRWNQTDVGPFLASVLATPAGTIAKGLSIRVGDRQQAAVAYDMKTASFRAAWTGGFIKFDPYKFGIVRTPAMAGPVTFATAAPAWGDAKAAYRGMHQHGRRVVLAFDVDGAAVLESPWAEASGDVTAVTRTIQIEPGDSPRTLVVFNDAKSQTPVTLSAIGKAPAARIERDGAITAWALVAEANTAALSVDGAALRVTIAPSKRPRRFKLLTWTGVKEQLAGLAAVVKSSAPPADLRPLTQPAPSLWPTKLTTRGALGGGKAGDKVGGKSPFAIDTIAVPFDNPWKALMFISGHDFFANGDIAVCTLHGDVWLVRGVDEKLDHVTWQRFATGLHQPLGLRIVDDMVYVLGRDQITRLHDTDGDGAADFYENFNNDGATSIAGHDFATCLQTDPDGNFYYIRAHEGVCRVTRDGKHHTSIATGFRNPNGMGVGPDGTITASPQEGEWTPASGIFQIRPGGYYGYGGPKVTADRPLGYDRPICWLPRNADNSSGGQVWVTSDRWGPLKGKMLHLSYGQCQMMIVLSQTVDGVAQGGTIKLPMRFASGVMRGRFSPRDGQLYLSGLRGWQTVAARDGCLQRVRYTGAPMHLPVALNVRRDGVAITFSEPLDRTSAADPGGYLVEVWNYRYSKQYGSKEYKVSDPKQIGRDELDISAVRMLDDRTVLLQLRDLQPVMQMRISYFIDAADGAPIRQTIYNTVHALAAP